MLIRRLIWALYAMSLCAPARADSIGDTVLAFGLVGAWSENCARDIAARQIFDVPSSGLPTYVFVDPAFRKRDGGVGKLTVNKEIVAVFWIDETKPSECR